MANAPRHFAKLSLSSLRQPMLHGNTIYVALQNAA
jgi:hypothetical protein